MTSEAPLKEPPFSGALSSPTYNHGLFPREQSKPSPSPDSNSERCMNPETIARICQERQLYETPYLNEKLYLHLKGFRKIEGLAAYTEVRALFLDANGIQRIQGLESLTKLRCLYLQQNCIEKIENLDFCQHIITLDLSQNHISMIENLKALTQLENLKLANNALCNLRALLGLLECRTSLITVDISRNYVNLDDSDNGLIDEIETYFSTPTKEFCQDEQPPSTLQSRLPLVSAPLSNLPKTLRASDMAEFHAAPSPDIDTAIDMCERTTSSRQHEKVVLSLNSTTFDLKCEDKGLAWFKLFLILLKKLPKLACLYFQGNPIVPCIPNYRKRLIHALPSLKYLDDRPVKECDRKASVAWATGGKEAEAAARKQYFDDEVRENKNSRFVSNLREIQKQHRQKMSLALQRIDKENEIKKLQNARMDIYSRIEANDDSSLDDETTKYLNEVEQKWRKRLKTQSLEEIHENHTASEDDEHKINDLQQQHQVQYPAASITFPENPAEENDELTGCLTAATEEVNIAATAPESENQQDQHNLLQISLGAEGEENKEDENKEERKKEYQRTHPSDMSDPKDKRQELCSSELLLSEVANIEDECRDGGPEMADTKQTTIHDILRIKTTEAIETEQSHSQQDKTADGGESAMFSSSKRKIIQEQTEREVDEIVFCQVVEKSQLDFKESVKRIDNQCHGDLQCRLRYTQLQKNIPISTQTDMTMPASPTTTLVTTTSSTPPTDIFATNADIPNNVTTSCSTTTTTDVPITITTISRTTTTTTENPDNTVTIPTTTPKIHAIADKFATATSMNNIILNTDIVNATTLDLYAMD